MSSPSRILSTCSALGLLVASTLLPLVHDALYHLPTHRHQHHDHAHSHNHAPSRTGVAKPHHSHSHDSAACQLCQSTLLALTVAGEPGTSMAPIAVCVAVPVFPVPLQIVAKQARGPPQMAVSPHFLFLTLVA